MNTIKILGPTKTVDASDPGQAFGMFKVAFPMKGDENVIFADFNIKMRGGAKDGPRLLREIKEHESNLKKAIKAAKQRDAAGRRG